MRYFTKDFICSITTIYISCQATWDIDCCAVAEDVVTRTVWIDDRLPVAVVTPQEYSTGFVFRQD